jgi:hypothetical protein
MAQFLGSPYFPIIIDRSGDPDIYNVGPIETPITANSSTLLSINQEGWSELQVMNGTLVQSVIAGSDSARLYVATTNLTSVKVTYLDEGTDTLSINLYNPYSKAWIYDYASIGKNDTNEWETYEFLAPLGEVGFVEFDLQARYENFTISRIEAAPFKSGGKASLYSLEKEITNATSPPTLMTYLPILYDNEKILVQTNSFGKEIGVEMFEGVIQPWETTGWWETHKLVASTYGQANPSLVWNAQKSGLYTLVIVLRDEYVQDTRVDLQIAVGGAK